MRPTQTQHQIPRHPLQRLKQSQQAPTSLAPKKSVRVNLRYTLPCDGGQDTTRERGHSDADENLEHANPLGNVHGGWIRKLIDRRGDCCLASCPPTIRDSAQDVLDALGVQRQPRHEPTTSLPVLTEVQERLLNALSLQPQHLDTLARATQLPIQQVQVELTMLEMMGLARRMPGGTFVRVL